MRTEKTAYLFNNIKSGDFLGFYKKPWYYFFAKLIFLITGNKLSHISGIFDVKREEDCVTFKVGEHMVSDDKVITQYSIVRSYNGYLIDSRFRDKDTEFFYLPNRNTLSDSQNTELSKYWNEEGDYSLGQLSFSQNWFYRLFGNKNKVYDGFCSAAGRQAMGRM